MVENVGNLALRDTFAAHGIRYVGIGIAAVATLATASGGMYSPEWSFLAAAFVLGWTQFAGT
jgi:hypothetical protein